MCQPGIVQHIIAEAKGRVTSKVEDGETRRNHPGFLP